MRKRMQRAAVLVMVFCLLIMGSRVGADAKVIRAKASGKAVNENSQMIIDYSNISKGYVMVKYKQSTKVKLKAQVADILVNECGLPELVPAEYGGTAEA